MGMNDINSLLRLKWNCKYHIVFAPKYRRKVLVTMETVCWTWKGLFATGREQVFKRYLSAVKKIPMVNISGMIR